jgi:hypothetical protein
LRPFHIPRSYAVRITLNPTAVGAKFERRDVADNQTFQESPTIAAETSHELHFDLTSPPVKSRVANDVSEEIL